MGKMYVENEIDARIDLEWLFNDSIGDLGLKSTHGAMVAMIESGGGATVATSESAELKMELSLDAADRFRRVSGGVRLLTPREQRDVALAFTRRTWPRELQSRPAVERYPAASSDAVRAFLKDLGSSRWSLPAASAWLVRAERPTKDSGVPAETLTALRLSAWSEAEATVARLLGAYGEAAREWGTTRAADRARRARAAA